MVKKIKMGRVQINISNRWLYTLITIGILAIISVGVYAWADPTTGVGHGPSEIGPGTFAGGGDYIFPTGSMVKVSDAPVASDDLITKGYVDALGGTTSCYWDYSGSCATGFTSLKTADYKYCFKVYDLQYRSWAYALLIPPGGACWGDLYYSNYDQASAVLGTAAFCCKD